MACSECKGCYWYWVGKCNTAQEYSDYKSCTDYKPR